LPHWQRSDLKNDGKQPIQPVDFDIQQFTRFAIASPTALPFRHCNFPCLRGYSGVILFVLDRLRGDFK
jgi:hypothetical protein